MPNVDMNENFVSLVERAARSKMGFVEDMVKRLRAGTSGEEVVSSVIAKYSTPCAQASKLSLVKRKALDAGIKHAEHDASLLRFVKVYRDAGNVPQPCADAFEDFMQAPLHMRVRLHRKHRKRAFCFGVDAVDEAFRQIKLLHPELEKLKPPTAVHDACDRTLYRRKLEKSERMFVLEDAKAFLDKLTAHLTFSDRRFTRSGCLIALLGTSGRRATEIVSPSSLFEPTDKKHVVRFTGQLKKLGEPESYNIPLLVPSSVWLAALRRFRDAQPERAKSMTPSELENSFGSAPREYLRKHFPEAGHIHNLRGIYAAMVCDAFDTGLYREQRVLFEILGHERIGETQSHYEQIQLRGFEGMRHALGKFGDVSAAVSVAA